MPKLIQFDDIYQLDVSIYEEEDLSECVTYQWYWFRELGNV